MEDVKWPFIVIFPNNVYQTDLLGSKRKVCEGGDGQGRRRKVEGQKRAVQENCIF
jgi:hypothetical protein